LSLPEVRFPEINLEEEEREQRHLQLVSETFVSARFILPFLFFPFLHSHESRRCRESHEDGDEVGDGWVSFDSSCCEGDEKDEEGNEGEGMEGEEGNEPVKRAVVRSLRGDRFHGSLRGQARRRGVQEESQSIKRKKRGRFLWGGGKSGGWTSTGEFGYLPVERSGRTAGSKEIQGSDENKGIESLYTVPQQWIANFECCCRCLVLNLQQPGPLWNVASKRVEISSAVW